MLHIATYYYVQVMRRFEHAYEIDKDFNNTAFEEKHPLSTGLTRNSVSFGSLSDPVHEQLGWQKTSIAELDMMAALLPFSWFFWTIFRKDLQVWTKTLMVH